MQNTLKPIFGAWRLVGYFGATLLFLLSIINFGFAGQQQADPRPNILWISCEDLSPHFDFYGDSTVKTPNLSALAKEGTVYRNVFATAGVCSPSRCAIITGMNQVSVGGHNMRTLLNTFPEKTGLPKSYSVVTPAKVKAFPEYLRAAGYYCTNNEKTDYQFEAPVTVWDEVSSKATWRGRKPGQPFFSVFNIMVTHESQVWMRKNHPLHVDPKSLKLPPYYPDTLNVRKDVARFFSNIVDLDSIVGTLIAQLKQDGLYDNTVIFFWSDHGDGLPYSKRELYDRGLKIPLIVRSKEVQKKKDELISTIDFAPTVLSLAGIKPPDHMQGKAFLGKYASKTPNEFVYAARDRMDSEYDRVRVIRDRQFKYIRNFSPELPNYQNVEYRLQQDMMRDIIALRDAGKLNEVCMRWFKTKPAEELYDLDKDPWELTNLAEVPQYASQLERMRAAFKKWLYATPDFGSVPEKELITKMWNGGTEPPATADVVTTEKSGKVTLSCATEGASIGYKIFTEGSEAKSWNVYSGPISVKKGERLKAISHRIGFKPGPEILKTF